MVFYAFQIIDSLLIQEPDVNDKVKSGWTQQFLAKGGFQYIQSCFNKAMAKPYPSDMVMDSANQIQMQNFNSILQKYDILASAAIRATNPEAVKVMDQPGFAIQKEKTTVDPTGGKGVPFIDNEAKKGILKNKLTQPGGDYDETPITQETLFGTSSVSGPEPVQPTTAVVVPTEKGIDFKSSSRYQELVELMKANDFGKKIATSLNFSSLQIDLSNLLC